MDILAKRLKQCRKNADRTQMETAIYCDITERTYQNYESGIHEPKVSILLKIAQFYGVSLDYLVGLTDEPAPYPERAK